MVMIRLTAAGGVVGEVSAGPLGPLGFNSPNIAQRHALHVERTAEKAVMLSDRVEFSSAEARVEEIKGGAVEVIESVFEAFEASNSGPERITELRA